MTRFVPRALAPLLAVFLGSLAVPARAEDFVIEPKKSATLAGEHFFDKVKIDGTLNVAKYDAADPTKTSGWLRIRANEIVLSKEGLIDASERGFRGQIAGGEGFGTGAGKTVPVTETNKDLALPAGGGAHLGAGGLGLFATVSGNKTTCTPFLGAEGGTSYDVAGPMAFALQAMQAQSGMGSAGGTSLASSANMSNALVGGNGGGVIFLEAATISLLGKVTANGKGFMTPTLGCSAGGGAGGTVVIRTSKLSVDSVTTRLEATGGAGMAFTDATGSLVGGGGAGGLILLLAKDSLPASGYSVLGGASPIAACPAASGSNGTFLQLDQDCVDADGDGFGSASCGGDDCDDANPIVHPGVTEDCDGVDQDCDAIVDNGDPSTMCLKNEECTMGSCVPLPPPPDDPTDDTNRQVKLEGGLCTASPGRGGGAWVAAAIGAAAVVARAARRRRPARS